MAQGKKTEKNDDANCGQAELVPIIRWKVSPSGVVFPDSCAGYDT